MKLPGQLSAEINKQGLASLLGFVWQNECHDPHLVLHMPATRLRKGHQLRLILPGPEAAAAAPTIARGDDRLIALLAEAREAQQLVLARPDRSLASIATAHKVCRKRLGKLIALSCLAPDIVTAVMEDRQPSDLTALVLLKAELPLDWDEQRQMLGLG